MAAPTCSEGRSLLLDRYMDIGAMMSLRTTVPTALPTMRGDTRHLKLRTLELRTVVLRRVREATGTVEIRTMVMLYQSGELPDREQSSRP